MRMLYRVHHYAAAGYVDYYRYYKLETSALNALIGKGPIRQVGTVHTLQRWHGWSQTWEHWATKDTEGTHWNEIGSLVA